MQAIHKYISNGYRHIRQMDNVKLEAKLFVDKADGKFAIVRRCTICSFTLSKPKERNPGRGWGMREGNILRGKMVQHVKDEHGHLLEQ